MVTTGGMDCKVARWEAGRPVRSSAWVTGQSIRVARAWVVVVGMENTGWIWGIFRSSQWCSDDLGMRGGGRQ